MDITFNNLQNRINVLIKVYFKNMRIGYKINLSYKKDLIQY
jgi:hypothetical protein